MRLAALILRCVGIAFYWLGLRRALIWLRRRSPRVLVYHACDDGENEFIQGLTSNTRVDLFRAHLDFLVRYYVVVPLSAVEDGSYPDRAAVITFDDGYRSVYLNAFPVLRKLRMRTTMYLTTEALDGAVVWVNALNFYLHTSPSIARPVAAGHFGLPARTAPAQIVEEARIRYDRGSLEELLERLKAATGIDAGVRCRAARLHVSWDEVALMARDGVSFGNHTATHPNLSRLDEAHQRLEIGRAQAAVRQHLGTCTSFAYPFGDGDATARRVAVELGCASILERGSNLSQIDPEQIGRLSADALRVDSLFAELEVVAPIKARVKRWLGR